MKYKIVFMNIHTVFEYVYLETLIKHLCPHLIFEIDHIENQMPNGVRIYYKLWYRYQYWSDWHKIKDKMYYYRQTGRRLEFI